MSLLSKVFSNTFYQIAGKVVTAMTTLITTALITRMLGAATFGEYSIVMAYTTTFYMIADFGINIVAVKDFDGSFTIARKRFTSLLSLRFVLGFILLLVAFLSITYLPYTKEIKAAIYISLPLIVLNSIFKSAQIIFQAFLKYSLMFWSNFIGSFVGLSLVLYLLFLSDLQVTLFMLVTIIVIGSTISPIAGLFFTRKYLSFSHGWFDYIYWKKIFWQAFPLGISLTLNLLMIQADRLILSFLKSPISVGIYSLSYRIFELVLVLPTFFMNALYPVLVKLKAESHEKYLHNITVGITLLSAMAIIATIGITIVSPFVIPFVWGDEMLNSYIPLNILMYGSIFFFLTAPLSWIAVLEDKQKILPYIYGIGFIFNIVFNFLFIPRYDYIGAAIVTIFTEALMLVALVYLLKKHKN